ncbi:hypothetical protein NH26_04245 [Flammeovirga pacifica]|uniref:DUF4184 domain-containing protein n=1 Tax=Flammeovirga pacifica TaxID=915059 RepID=A0A1S1YX74_FLAPC|nr:hypothetical protein NH26_04245 [Flammeovirga pacifica]
MIGVFTHIIFDGLTSRSGYFVQHISLLNFNVDGILGFSMPFYIFLWYSLTILGLMVLLFQMIKSFFTLKELGYELKISWLRIATITLLWILLLYIGIDVLEPKGYLRWGILLGGTLFYSVLMISTSYYIQNLISLQKREKLLNKERFKS